ncbi:MAG: response regulator, partial [Rikenellaceae bacterium]
MKAIAIDDEPLALSVIDIFCRKSPMIDLVAQFSGGREGLSYLDEHDDIDLIFLDINMPHLSGVEVAKMVAHRAMIIFTTAYQDFAVEGFELEAVDYLMKPFSFERFSTAADRAYELLQLRRGKEGDNVQQKDVSHIMVKSDSSLVKIAIDSIIVIEGLKD